MSSPMQMPSVMLCIACENTMPQRNAMEMGKTFLFIPIHPTFSQPDNIRHPQVPSYSAPHYCVYNPERNYVKFRMVLGSLFLKFLYAL